MSCYLGCSNRAMLANLSYLKVYFSRRVQETINLRLPLSLVLAWKEDMLDDHNQGGYFIPPLLVVIRMDKDGFKYRIFNFTLSTGAEEAET